jgi:RNA polymerase sigma-70 factor (ECF subfamily)
MAEPRDPDAALMRRVQRGDREAFAALVERYRQPVWNFIRRTIPDEAEAEDLTQSVFVQVWKSAKRYRVNARFSTWLFTIARNLSLNEIRRRTRHRAESLDATYAEHDDQPLHQAEDKANPIPPDALLRTELYQKVEEALRDLPEPQRTALLLCREEDVSYEEIAEVLGLSLSATKSVIHRARGTLRTRLKAYLRSGAWEATGNDEGRNPRIE